MGEEIVKIVYLTSLYSPRVHFGLGNAEEETPQ